MDDCSESAMLTSAKSGIKNGKETNDAESKQNVDQHQYLTLTDEFQRLDIIKSVLFHNNIVRLMLKQGLLPPGLPNLWTDTKRRSYGKFKFFLNSHHGTILL